MTEPFRLPPVTEIAVSTPPGQVLAAELRGGRVWAIHWHWEDDPAPGGAVHAIRITRLAPEAKGAFARADEAGTEAFLDLSGSKYRPHEGERLLAQVTRRAADGKRLTLRPDVRLSGRYLVYTPQRPGVAISRQIRDKAAAQRLQGLLRSRAHAGEGIIVRAAAAVLGENLEPLAAELARHREAWRQAEAATGLGPCLPAPDLLDHLLMERPGAGPLAIHVHSRRAAQRLEQAAATWCPTEPVTVVREPGNPFAAFGAQEALDQAFLPEVPLEGGGRLWIERTRACWTVDIDSAGAAHATTRDARLALNRAAAVETARQVRLRGIAGAVVIDFLKTADAAPEAAVLQDLRAAFAEDPAALRFNERLDALGLFAFSRQRLGPELAAMRADGGRKLALLNGLGELARQSLGDPARSYVLAIAPGVGKLAASMPLAIAETARRLGQQPFIETDPALAPDAFEVRPASDGDER